MRDSADLIRFSGSTGKRRIAVFRASYLGDMLCAVPALRALRAAAPNAHVTLIGLPWSASFAGRFFRYIDAHVSFPGFPGLTECTADISRIPQFIASMQAQRFDCVLQMHGDGRLSNPLLMTFGAARIAGFYRSGEFCPDPESFLPWDDRQHEVVRNLQLVNFLGAPSQGEDLEFPLMPADFRALFASHVVLPAPGSYVCLHPGARLPARRWPAARFAALADRLHDAGLRVVLTGSMRETALAAAVMRAMRAPALNFAGKTDLGAFAALLAQTRLVVCNDTGISHLAAALKTPSVTICCGPRAAGDDPARWAPLNTRRHRIVDVGVGHAHADTGEAVLRAACDVLAANPASRNMRADLQSVRA